MKVFGYDFGFAEFTVASGLALSTMFVQQLFIS